MGLPFPPTLPPYHNTLFIQHLSLLFEIASLFSLFQSWLCFDMKVFSNNYKTILSFFKEHVVFTIKFENVLACPLHFTFSLAVVCHLKTGTKREVGCALLALCSEYNIPYLVQSQEPSSSRYPPLRQFYIFYIIKLGAVLWLFLESFLKPADAAHLQLFPVSIRKLEVKFLCLLRNSEVQENLGMHMASAGFRKHFGGNSSSAPLALGGYRYGQVWLNMGPGDFC